MILVLPCLPAPACIRAWSQNHDASRTIPGQSGFTLAVAIKRYNLTVWHEVKIITVAHSMSPHTSFRKVRAYSPNGSTDGARYWTNGVVLNLRNITCKIAGNQIPIAIRPTSDRMCKMLFTCRQLQNAFRVGIRDQVAVSILAEP